MEDQWQVKGYTLGLNKSGVDLSNNNIIKRTVTPIFKRASGSDNAGCSKEHRRAASKLDLAVSSEISRTPGRQNYDNSESWMQHGYKTDDSFRPFGCNYCPKKFTYKEDSGSDKFTNDKDRRVNSLVPNRTPTKVGSLTGFSLDSLIGLPSSSSSHSQTGSGRGCLTGSTASDLSGLKVDKSPSTSLGYDFAVFGNYTEVNTMKRLPQVEYPCDFCEESRLDKTDDRGKRGNRTQHISSLTGFSAENWINLSSSGLSHSQTGSRTGSDLSGIKMANLPSTSLGHDSAVFGIHTEANSMKKLAQVEYTCEYCGEEVYAGEDLEAYLSNTQSHRCSYCTKVFPRKCDLTRHMLIHSGVKAFSCDICGRSFRLQQHLKRHKFVVHNVVHQSSSRKKITFPPLCGWARKTKNVQKWNDGFIFLHCIYSRPTRYNAIRRGRPSAYRSDSSDLLPHTAYTAGQVDVSSRPVENVADELNLANVRSSAHICQYCSKIFGNKTDLGRHVLIHTGVKPHKYYGHHHVSASKIPAQRRRSGGGIACQLCGSQLKSKQNLQIHMLTHTGEKPWTCSYCGKKFRRKHHLDGHIYSQHSQLVHQ
ncbi:zinc finger protein 544-like [Mercenaria mercenaria]|uniref:zinc finger protein 544-like n=1 Tax=Mercenaria mercenaria TaxID=6596 RepID=UPI00234F9D41|nr:zinc finger protein 544-like [Mercenaria mercenaria]